MRAARRLAGVMRSALCVAATAASIGAGPALTAETPPAGFVARPADAVRVRDDGRWAVAEYATDGTQLRRYTGFSEISGLAWYDERTLLVAERERDRVSALSLEGRILWEIPVPRPGCVQALARQNGRPQQVATNGSDLSRSPLGPDHLLVCTDKPAGVREIDLAGRTSWQASVRDVAAAVRLADGNTAVLESTRAGGAVRVINAAGDTLWSGNENLLQPRGLALLASGELLTSAFDNPYLVLFRPYAKEVHTIVFFPHAESVAVTKVGGVISTLPEPQIVQAWDSAGQIAWRFETLYPPHDAEMSETGTVFVSLFEAPDRECLGAAAAAERSTRPLAPYWRWLIAGLAGGALLAIALRRSELRGVLFWRGASVARSAERTARLAPARRLEIGFYVAGALALAAAAVRDDPRIAGADVPTYAALVSLAGIVLAILRSRMPAEADDWALRMRRLEPMAAPTRRMWALWGMGGGLLVLATAGAATGQSGWVGGAWGAGIVLVAGGALEPGKIPRPSLRAVLCAGLVLSGLLALRLVRLESYPANLHPDSALATLQVFRLLDGDDPGIFGDGWAEIPMPGYLWRALNVAVSGRSLAGARFPSAMGSMLAIAATFFLGRRLYGGAAAAITAALLGVDQVFLHFSRISSTYMDPVPFQVLALLGMVSGLETGRFGWFALAGFTGGYGALTYHAGRLTPVLLALLTGLLLAAYPKALAMRWRGLVLTAVMLLGVLGPQAALYAERRANPYGRFDQFPWMRADGIDAAALRESVARGAPLVLGSLWVRGDSSNQYKGESALFPPIAALLAIAATAALLRPRSVRDLWVIAWAAAVLFFGGVLTRDPPFWPRLVVARIPLVLAAAAAASSLARAAAVSAGRLGSALALVVVGALVCLDAADQLSYYRGYVLGIPRGASQPRQPTERPQSIMGRDVQSWGRGALVYIVARTPVEHSCGHPVMQFYAAEVDARDVRDVGQYLPFHEPSRTVVCYLLPEMKDAAALITSTHPNAERQDFQDNLGQTVFTRLVIRPAAGGEEGRR